VSEIPGEQAAQSINRCFEQWGLPKCIKIDNGLPLALPAQRDIPTLTELWWVGLGIEVLHNKPACPQQNGTVEGLQGVCFRWAEPARCALPQDLQQTLEANNFFQRENYKVPAKKKQTRRQLYPDLWERVRPFGPDSFQFERVQAFLSTKVWQREIKKSGSIKLFNTEIFISQARKMIGVNVSVTYDKEENIYFIKDLYGKLLKTCAKALVSEEVILLHAGMSKNNGGNLIVAIQ